MRQELDSSDVVAFPEEIFGKASLDKAPPLTIRRVIWILAYDIVFVNSTNISKDMNTAMLSRHVRPTLRGWWPLLRVLLSKGRGRRTLGMALAIP